MSKQWVAQKDVGLMSDKASNPESALFPILKGESVGASGEFSGRAVLIMKPEDLEREWAPDEIPVIKKDMEEYFKECPGAIDELFSQVSAVISEAGESVGECAAIAFIREVLCLVKVRDACFVLENDMRIRITASENVGEVFFVE
ncbi:MAG: hypothetical protein ACTSPE_10265 [Candidatus Thorarchaeota archaeon]